MRIERGELEGVTSGIGVKVLELLEGCKGASVVKQDTNSKTSKILSKSKRKNFDLKK